VRQVRQERQGLKSPRHTMTEDKWPEILRKFFRADASPADDEALAFALLQAGMDDPQRFMRAPLRLAEQTDTERRQLFRIAILSAHRGRPDA
jgi:transposase